MKIVLPLMLVLAPQIVSAQPPEALWLPKDRSVVIASGSCGEGSPNMCAFIVGLKNEEYKQWASQLCGLPLLWDLRPGTSKGRWVNGRLLDPETEKVSGVNVTVLSEKMVLAARDGSVVTLQKTKEKPEGCSEKKK